MAQRSKTVTRRLWVRFPTRENELLFINILITSLWYQGKNAALNSTTQHTVPHKFSGKWETQCINTRFPLFTLLYAGYMHEETMYIRLYIDCIFIKCSYLFRLYALFRKDRLIGGKNLMLKHSVPH